jgi:chromosome segregation ATPase
MSGAQAVETQKRGDYVMMDRTPGAQIDELRRVIGESEQRRQAAEVKLADCERRLGTARQTIAAQDRRIGSLTSEVARLRDAAASIVPADYARDARRFFSVYSFGGAR